uniref:Glycerol-3-phosphate dehydrogenase [NAD(P)+] n=1 Tax=Acidobacterium capsulatum TaxID=33075 RepID=A0A7V4XU05_9BACT
MSRIAVMGSGAWGTAIALHLARQSEHELLLWSHSARVAESIRAFGENRDFLPGYPIPRSLAVTVTADAEAALEFAEIIISVMPSHHVRHTYEHIFAPYLTPSHRILSATKGLEDATCLRMTQVMQEVLARRGLDLPLAVLGGPSFAQEVATGSPTAVTVASKDAAFAAELQQAFSNGTLRLYTNDDVCGVEMGGALKNIIAIASGVVTGLGLGHNSTAAIITRGIAEMTRLAVACGGRRETLAGLAGLGDLVLTCTGSLSRNRTVGVELGKGRALDDILASLGGKVAEGVRTTAAALGLAATMGVEMPIAQQVHTVLQGQASPLQAMQYLMSRPGRDE